MHGTYGYTRTGCARYLQNRALRLYPNYWFALLVSLAVIALFGKVAVRAYNPHMIVPPTPAAWLENLTMIFFGWFPKEHVARLVPPTWALTVEIFYYILIGFGISRSRRTTILWMVLSAAYVVAAYAAGGGGPNLYSAVPAGSLPFAMGALTYHYRADLYRLLSAAKLNNALFLIVVRWVSCAAFASANAMTGRGWLISLGNYANIVISMLIVCTLFYARPDVRLHHFDRAVGDLSYPIYLLHWQGAAVASMLVYGELVHGWTTEGVVVAAWGLVLTILLGLVCARIIDPAVELRRTRIRSRAVDAGSAG
jgi:peptidoglycan/LPS O-acetylase OafA/YrhL